MNPDSAPVIRRHVTGGSGSGELHLAPAGGIMWATNAYWAAPATRVAPLLRQFNLDPDAPGAYEVKGSTVTRLQDSRVRSTWAEHLAPDEYEIPLTEVKVAGGQAYSRTTAGEYLAVYQAADGAFLGLSPDRLEWLNRMNGIPVEEGCFYALGSARLLAAGENERPARTVAVVASLRRTTRPGYSEGGTYHPAESDLVGRRVIAVIAGLKLGADRD